LKRFHRRSGHLCSEDNLAHSLPLPIPMRII
jgi:hypothetical protein